MPFILIPHLSEILMISNIINSGKILINRINIKQLTHKKQYQFNLTHNLGELGYLVS